MHLKFVLCYMPVIKMAPFCCKMRILCYSMANVIHKVVQSEIVLIKVLFSFSFFLFSLILKFWQENYNRKLRYKFTRSAGFE